MAATTDRYVYLGIFDDGDVAPTVCIMGVLPGEEFTVNDALELRVEAERLYGRQAPDHALFWEAQS